MGKARVAILAEFGARGNAGSTGGSATSALRLARAMNTFGLDVRLFTPRLNQFKNFDSALYKKTPVVAVGTGHKYIQNLRAFVRLLFFSPDVIIANESRAIQTALAFKRLCKRPKLLCVFHHENNLNTTGQKKSHQRKRAMLAQLVTYADAVISVSPGIKALLLDKQPMLRDRTYVLNNAVYSECEIKEASKRPAQRPKEDSYNVVFIGRLSREKNAVMLVDVLAQLRNTFQMRTTLTLCGTGEQESEIKSRAIELGVTDDIFIRGFVREPLRFLVDADCFVNPSKREAFGNVLVEALAMGVPVVSTDCPAGPRYILDDGRFGELVPVDDQSEMTKRVAEVLNGANIKTGSKERAKKFSEEVAAKAYLELIEGAKSK